MIITAFASLDAGDSRNGAMVELGIGTGFSSLFGQSTGDANFMILSDFSLGSFINSNVALYFNSKTAWVLSEKNFANELASFSISYYIEETISSPLFSAGIGFASLGALSGNNMPDFGWGIHINGGYEFYEYCSVRLGFMYTMIFSKYNYINTVSGNLGLIFTLY